MERSRVRPQPHPAPTIALLGPGGAALQAEIQAALRTELVTLGAAADAVGGLVAVGPADAEAEVRAARSALRTVPVVALGAPEAATILGAFRGGAVDFVPLPLDGDALADVVARHILSTARLTLRGVRKADTLVGVSRVMQEVRAQLERAAMSSAPVLLLGESGTGKELAARAIHYTGPRRAGPFIAVNAGAVSESLAEAELFGARRGAYTGAERDREGLVAAASGGTLFLDEIATAPMALQVKLLRVLERGEITPVGGSRPVEVDVRILAATNADVRHAIARGAFREDLFYRVAGIQVTLPPVRERKEDISLLFAHHLGLLAAQAGREPPHLSADALAKLVGYAWPGNVREITHVCSNALITCGDVVTAGDVRLPADAVASSVLPFREARRQFESAYVREVLAAAGGSVTVAARLAGRERKDFYELCRRAGVDPTVVRSASGGKPHEPDLD